MRVVVLALSVFACLAAPVMAQEVVFADDCEANSGLWFSGFEVPGDPVDWRAVDPLNATNQVIRPSWNMWAGPNPNEPLPDMWSASLPLEPSSTYVLSFRFLDESPDVQRGSVALKPDPTGTEEYAMPFQLIADGTWHEYSFEFTPSELFGPGIGSVAIALFGAYECAPWYGQPCYEAGETWVYFDDFRVDRVGSVRSESRSWGRVKALFR